MGNRSQGRARKVFWKPTKGSCIRGGKSGSWAILAVQPEKNGLEEAGFDKQACEK